MELPRINFQAREGAFLDTTGCLEVVRVFRTIQGEGPLAGTPAVFIRLAGCNLSCKLCDTDYTSVRQIYTPGEILRAVRLCRNISDLNLVVITGGEPFRQNLGPLVRSLLDERFRVQIETNGTVFYHPGTMFWEDFPGDDGGMSIVISPKTPTVNRELAALASAWKYMIEAGAVDPVDGLPTSVLGDPIVPARFRAYRKTGREVFVQPVDDPDPKRSRDNVRTAVETCIKYGYRLSLQIHKFLGVE